MGLQFEPLSTFQPSPNNGSHEGIESEGRESCRRGYCDGCSRSAEEERHLQACWCTYLKLKKKPARPARKGVNPFTKEPCVFKAKPASKTVRALPMKKLKEMIN